MMFQYCFRLTRRGEYELAEDVLMHLLYSNAYRDRDSHDTVRLTIIGQCIADFC